jgi:type VI secretion system protein ImpB
MAVNKASNNAQKFIGRNRAPRVQIEYDVEIYGSERKIELPFVMAVLSDLSGKPIEPLPPVSDRKFLDIDIDNFDERMKAIKPRVAFSVPNTLTGDGYLMVDMTFESMDDFSPAAVARKVDALNRLLEARTQLSNLQTYMDGKSGAEGLINQLLQDPALMKALASAPKPKADEQSVDKGSVKTKASATVE